VPTGDRNALTNPDQYPDGHTFQKTRLNEDTGIIEVTSHTLNPNDADDAATLGTLQSELEDSLQLFQSLTEQDNLRLQQAAQEQQRIMQLLSNLMKIQHDTVKAIIGNVRA
jgi:hypothetical protein